MCRPAVLIARPVTPPGVRITLRDSQCDPIERITLRDSLSRSVSQMRTGVARAPPAFRWQTGCTRTAHEVHHETNFFVVAGAFRNFANFAIAPHGDGRSLLGPAVAWDSPCVRGAVRRHKQSGRSGALTPNRPDRRTTPSHEVIHWLLASWHRPHHSNKPACSERCNTRASPTSSAWNSSTGRQSAPPRCASA